MSQIRRRFSLISLPLILIVIFVALFSGRLPMLSGEARSISKGFALMQTPPPPTLIDDFNDNSIDTNKWTHGDLFSGFTDFNVPIAETAQRLEIGPLLENTAGSHYRGIRSVNSYNFTSGSAYVELVQTPSSSAPADAMFTVGYSVTAYYRLFVNAGVLYGQRKIDNTKTTLFSLPYDSVAHRFLRIRHDATTNSVTLDTAPNNAGAPGTWVQRYTETWHSLIPLDSTLFEMKGGTGPTEATAPGKVIFDNFRFDSPVAPPSSGDNIFVADDFDNNSLDTNRWNPSNLFSGFTDTNIPLAETGQQFEIGPLLQNGSGSHYRGIRTVNSYDLTGAYSYVELVQAAASNTAADSMFTVGSSVDNYYRFYVNAGTLYGQKKIAGTKTTLFTLTYDPVAHRFLRIRHDADTNHVSLDTAPGSGGVPGAWVQRHTETWNSAVQITAIIFEVKGGTSNPEANAPGKVIFDNFKAGLPGPVVGLTSVSTTFNGYVGIDYHEPTNKVLSSAFAPTGQPHNFELLAADGSRTAFSNLAGISGSLKFATARNDSGGSSLGGFQPGEVITSTNAAGTLARISADGASVQNPWVSLPGETGSIGGLYLDRTGVFSGDLIAVTSTGRVWRVKNSGKASQVVNLSTGLEGVVVVPDDGDVYGPWAGKIIAGAKSQGAIYSVNTQGSATSHSFGGTVTDLRIVPAHQNFYGVDSTSQKIWAAPASFFSNMIGDVLIAEDDGTLSRARWDGEEFQVAEVAQVSSWKQIAFSPAGVTAVPNIEQVHIKIAIVRHAPQIDSGRVEGSLWQLNGDDLTLDGTDVITSDLLVPGTPTVSIIGSPNFAGVLAGTQSTSPTGYSVSIGGNSTLRHLITRTDAIQLENVSDPPAPNGTREVTLTSPGQSAGDWTTLRNLTISGRAGAIEVPPGTYGDFSASGRNSFVLGEAGSTQPTVYNFESLSLSGGTQLTLAGPVVLTIKDTLTMVGSTAGVADGPNKLTLKIASNSAEALKLSGRSVLYGIVRAPNGTVVIEGSGRLRGTVSCDRLIVSGNGVLQVTETDLPPPSMNRPPVVDAGPDQTITLPVSSINLNGAATDDGLPTGSSLAVSWSKISGPGTVTFSSANNLATNATFSAAGTYVLRLSASDSLLTVTDDVTVTVLAQNQAPTVTAGPDKIITLPDNASLDGSVSDDGLPGGTTLSITWSKVSGPGTVTFGNASAPLTTATFGTAGTYTLRLTANDSEFQVNDETVITVKAANVAPTVNAGTDQTITQPGVASLSGSASDDGLPTGSTLTTTWTTISGPASVSFANANQLNTTATFTVPGVYSLRLTAGDSQLTSTDDIAITVNPAPSNQAPVVNAGPDRQTTLISGTTPVNYILDVPGFMATTASPPVAINFDDIAAGTNINGMTISGVTFAMEGPPATTAPPIVVNGWDTFTPSGYTGIEDITKNRLYPTTGDQVLSPGGLNLHPTDPLLQNDKIRMTLAQPVSAIGFDILFQSLDTQSFVSVTVLGPSGETLFTNSSIPTGSGYSGGPPAGVVFVGFVSGTANIKTIIVNDTDGNGVNPDSNIGIDSIRLVQTLPSDGGLTLVGTATDDGLPNPPASVTPAWSKVSGPGTVTFGSGNQLQTTVSFSAAGTYVLRLTGSDSALSGTDDVTVVVDPVNHAPVTRASTFIPEVTLPNSKGVGGNVNDDGLPAGSVLTFSWTKVDGPGTATFTFPNNLNTSVSFSQAGFYILKLTASDGQYSSSSLLGITVHPATPTPTPTPVPSPTPTPSNQASPGWIGGPVSGSSVTGLVPITLGAGTTLTQGTVEYWPVNNPSNVTVLTTSAQGAPGATVATLDTTILINGAYVIRLTGTDSNSTQLVSLIEVIVSGENKPGRMVVTTTDLIVPLAGLPIKIARRYDSLERKRVDDFGMGWSLESGNVNLEVNAHNDVTFTDPATSRRVTFRFTPRRHFFPISWGFFPSYTPEPGTFGTLATDGCSLLTRQDDGSFQCSFTGAYAPTTFAYTDSRGTVFTMTIDGNLHSIKTVNGETLTFSSTGITSSSGGANVAFVRDGQGRITQITDPAGKVYGYGYSGAGDLTSVDLPDIATNVSYTYNTDHLLLTSTDSRGNPEATATYYSDGRLQSITDALNQTTSYAYNLTTNTTTTTNPDGGVETRQLDANGMLLNETNALGHTTTYTYDTNRNQLTEVNALNQTTSHTYDANGNRTSTTDALGRVTRATFSSVGLPLTTTNPLGGVRNFTYDSNFNPTGISDSIGTFVSITNNAQGNPATVTDGAGGVSTFTYDTFGNKLTETDPLNHTTTYTYDAMGRVLTETNARNAVTTYTYDALGRVLTFKNAKNEITTFEYDANGNRTAEIDALNRRMTFVYDVANRLIRVEFPDNTTINYTYNFRDQKLTETDQAGKVTTYTYDLAGRLTKTKYADGAEETVTYDAIGRVLTATDERGNVTTFEYDTGCGCSDRVTKITDALGRHTQYQYDTGGRPIRFIDANNRETHYSYDARHRMTTITYADGTTLMQSYDGGNRLLTRTDQAGKITQFGYDLAGNTTSVTNALNHTTTYSYDVVNNLLTQTDANNRSTSFEYDLLDRATKRTLPLGMAETQIYNTVGDLTEWTDFRGKKTTYAYDSLNRLLSKTPDASLSEPTVTFTYTPVGQRATMVDSSGTTNYAYDNRHRLISKQTPQGTLTYTYNSASSVSTVRSSHANGVSIDYTHDALNRLESVVDNRLGTTSYTYDLVGNLASESRPNGVASTYSYNSTNRLVNLSIARTSATLNAYSYTLDPTGRRLSETERNGRSVTYAYDAAYRLISDTISGNADSANNGAVSYAYDSVGNRLSRSSTLAALSSQSFTYDANDRLSADTYDANGNTLTSSGSSFTYDYEDRLKSANSGAITIVYDGDGNRVAKTVGGVTTRYLIDDLNPTGYAQVVEEVVSGQVRRQYTWGHTIISQRQLLNGQWRASFYGIDGHGSVRMLTDVDGVVTDTFDYDAFGNLVSRVGSTPNNYLYSGEQFDPDLNIYFQRARYYNQQRGRFLSMDPFAGFIDEPDTLHKYLYVGNDPVNFTDPSGLAEMSEWAHRARKQVRDLFVYMRTHGRAILCRTIRTASIILSIAEAEDGYQQLMGKSLEFALAFCPCKFTPGAAPPGLPRMNPADILFSQPTVSPNFSKDGTVDDLVRKLRRGYSPDKVDPIRIFQRNGKTYTLDNRRLLAFFYGGVKDIPVIPVDPTDPDIADEIKRKFKPIFGGKMVVVTPEKGRKAAERLLRKFKKYGAPCP